MKNKELKPWQNVFMALTWSAAFIAFLFIINGCQKEEKNTGCQCYEEHQEINTSNQMQWETTYTTPPQAEDCSNAHGWVETAQHLRYRKICQ